jgi:excisionase family DNA binding protein
MTFDPYPEYMTIEEAAGYLGVSPVTIRRLLRQHGLGEFLRASMNKQVRIRKADLDAIDVARERSLRSIEGGEARGGRRTA